MSLRPREYTLESLEQRMLLSADGLVPTVSAPHALPGYSPADIILMDEHNGAIQPASHDSAADNLVDTTAPAATETQTTDVAPATTETTNETPTATSVTVPANPDVPSAADLLVTTLHLGNGPPLTGTTYVVGGTDSDDLSAWDPPLGGFNFTATNADIPTRNADYAALTALFDGTSNTSVTLKGKIEKSPDGGTGTTFSFGELTLNGTLKFDLVSGTGVNRILAVSFNSLDSASITANGTTLGLVVGKGAFLISGDLANPNTTGGMAGTMNVSGISVTTGGGSTTFTFADPSGSVLTATLSLNTAGAAAVAAATAATDLAGTGLTFNYTGTASFLKIAGNLGLDLSTASLAVKLTGDFVFQIADTNGATAGGQTITFALTNGSAKLAIAGASLSATNINGAFLINSAGIAGWTTVGDISASLGGMTFSALSNVSFKINTTNTAVTTTVGATSINYTAATELNFVQFGGTVTLALNQNSVAASLTGSFTFDRATVGADTLIRFSVVEASTSLTAGGRTLAVNHINGSFVMNSAGVAGQASVGDISLTGFSGLVASNLYLQINTTNSEIVNMVIPGGATLNFQGNERKKFFSVQGHITIDVSWGAVSATLDGTFYFEKYSFDPDDTGPLGITTGFKFAALGASASFTAGPVTFAVTNITGGFLITADGVAGYVEAGSLTVTGVPGLTFNAEDITFGINNTGKVVDTTFDIAGSPDAVVLDYTNPSQLDFVSVGATFVDKDTDSDGEIDSPGFSLSLGSAVFKTAGSLAFYAGTIEDAITHTPTEVVKFGVNDLNASLTIAGITASITHVKGFVVLMGDKSAGRIQFGEMTISGINDFTFSATNFAFEFNNTGLAVDEQLVVGTATLTLDYQTPETANFFRGSGHLTVAFDNGGSFKISIEGSFAFEKYTLDSGEDVVKFAFDHVNFEVAVGTGGVALVIDDASGFFLFGNNTHGDASYAGRLKIATAHLDGVDGLTFTIDSFDFEINTFGESVEASIDIPGPDDFTLDFTASDRWDFIALGGVLNFQVQLGGLDFQLSGGFYFEQANVTIDDGVLPPTTEKIIKVSVADGHFNLGIGGIVLNATDINGAFLIKGDGKSAGRLSIGHVGLTGIKGLTFTVDDFALEFNNTGGEVKANIPVAGDPDGVDLDYSDPAFYSFLRVGGTLHLGLTVGSFVAEVHGTFVFEQDNVSGKMLIGLKDAGLTVGAGKIKLIVDDVDGLFALYKGVDDGNPLTDDGRLAMHLKIGLAEMEGIPHLTLQVTNFFLDINNTGGPVSENFIFADDPTHPEVLTFAGNILSLGGSVIFGLKVGTFEATITGTFIFEQDNANAKMKIGIKNAGMIVAAGNIKLNITGVNGLFVFYSGSGASNGTMAIHLSVVGVTLEGIPALTLGVTNFFLDINNTGGPVSESFAFADDPTHPKTLSFTTNILSLGGTVDFGLKVGGFEAHIIGSFIFEQQTGKMTIGIKNAHFSLTLGVVNLSITGINGAFVFYSGTTSTNGTMAIKLNIGAISVTGIPKVYFSVQNFFLQINNTGQHVVEHLVFGDGSSIDMDYLTDRTVLGGTAILGIGGADPVNNPMLQLTAVGVTINTGATGDDLLFSALSLSGQLTLAAIGGTIRVNAHNLGITASGHLVNYDDPITTSVVEKFGVEVFFGGRYKEVVTTPGPDGLVGTADDVKTTVENDYTGDTAPTGNFQWPSWMPLKIRYLALEWDDVGANPEDFDLTITAALDLTTIPGITISGYVENLVIDVGELTAGRFPIKSFDAAALYVSGTLFGVTVSGGFVIGMVKTDAAYREASDPLFSGTLTQTVFYAGLQLKVQVGTMGLQFAVGLAKIGTAIVPLEVMVGVNAAIVIEPISGLTLGKFAGRVQFAHTLADDGYDGPLAMDKLKAVAANPSSTVEAADLATWVNGLRTSTLKIAQNIPVTGVGTASVWNLPMTISIVTGFYSSYVSDRALNGTLAVSFDTEGRILIAGQLSFGDADGLLGPGTGSLNLNAALYANLVNAGSSNFSFRFYASYGAITGPKPFEIEASLQVKILKSTLDAHGDREVWQKGADLDSEQATLSLQFDGKVRFLAGGAMIVQVEGSVNLEVDLGPTLGVRLKFAANVSVTDPTPNPLGMNFGVLAGYVSIFEDAGGHFQMIGAVKITFTGQPLKQYGINVNATVFLQINTTAIQQDVTLQYLHGGTETVHIRALSFSLYIQGDLTIGAPNSTAADAFIKMNGFVALEIDVNGLTLAFAVNVTLAPGGTQLLELKADGFMRINQTGIAARLNMSLVADFPPDSGLELEDATFTLVLNTTKAAIDYQIPTALLTGTPGEVTRVKIAQAAPVIGGDYEVPADNDSDPTNVIPGEAYFLIAIHAKLNALGITMEGNFFLVITETKFQLQVDASIDFGDIGNLAVHGFLEISSDGAAGLLSISTNLSLPGVQVVDAKFMLAFNTYDYAYEIPEPVADAFDIPYDATAPPTLGIHLLRIEITGTVKIGGTLELTGRFFFEQVTDGVTGAVTTTIEVYASLDMPVLGSLVVDGSLIIYDAASGHEGAVGSLTITLSAGNKSALTVIGITELSVTARLKVNTTNTALDDPGLAGTEMIERLTVSLDLKGTLKVAGLFTFDGHFYFEKSVDAQSNPVVRIEFDATLNIVIGKFHATGYFFSSSAGFKGLLTLVFDTSSSPLSGLGFEISGAFLMAINTTNSVMDLSTFTLDAAFSGFTAKTVVAHGLRIFVQGQLKILGGFFKAEGKFELSQGPGYLEISADATINLAGIVTLQVGGFVGIYDDNPATTVKEGGLVLSFDAHANLNLASVITGNADFAFRLNTTGISRTVPTTGQTLNSGYFRVAVTNIDASFLGILTVSGSLDITYDGTSVLKVAFTAKVDFFGIATIDLTGTADSTGKYDITFDGSLTIGISGFFGIGGTIHFHIKGEGEGVTLIEGRISGTAWLIGIGFGVDVDIAWDAVSGRLRASIALRLNFFLFSITIRGNFDLGYIKSTITYQAGTASQTRTGNGDEFPGGELWVNVGDRAPGRNYSVDEINEQIFISQLAANVVQIDLFGKKKQYDGVTSVHVVAGNGNDFVNVDASVTVPVFIDVGDGDDVVNIDSANTNNSITIWGGTGNDTVYGGNGAETIYAGDGDDYITSGGGNDTIYGGNGSDVIDAGAGVDTTYGEAGDDSFVWSSGDGQEAVISGGAGANTLSINGDNNANTLTVTARGTDFNAVIDGSTLSPTSVGTLYASLNGGADTVTLGLIDSTILDTIGLSLGYNDGAADLVTITASNTSDYYQLKSVSTTADRPVSTSYAGGVQTTTFSSVTTTQVQIAKTTGIDVTASALVNYSIDEAGYAEDRVVINGGDGNDNLDAGDVVATTIKLTLNGENGNDVLVGSNGADSINGGAGNDTLTGGPGVDTFSDTSGNDTLAEQMDRDFTLNGWTLTSAGEVENLTSAAFETITLAGGASANTFTISNLLANTLNLDGGEHNDVYTINVRGSGLSTINVNDRGVGVPNTDSLNINGTSGDDLFLIREGTITVGDPATAHAEIINYANTNAFTMHGGDGRDSFTMDDIGSAGTIYGDAGDDSFTVGRIVAAKVNGVMPPKPVGIQTIATTRGWLTYGNYYVFSIYGGDGDDYFEINHNQAELKLFGENGDDVFWIKTFLEEGSALSTVAGGVGVNLIRYVANGPLKIDGGAGFDRIILEGTEADDIFVITDSQIFGGGRQIDYVNIEGIVVLGVGGDDTFYVLGNGLPLEIQGGTGNDTVYVGGQAPDYVYDAPEYKVDPPAYIDHYDPVYTTPAPIVFTIPAHWEPVRWAGITWWWNYVPQYTISIQFPAYISSWTPVWVDPPEYTVDPSPITYRFKNVTQFNGVVNGVEAYNWAGARDYTKSLADDPNNPLRGGATPTPNRLINLGTIAAPVKFVGGNDPGTTDRLIVDLSTTPAITDLTATIQTVDEIITDYNLDTRVETLTNKGPIGQLLGFGLPNAVTSGGRTFMGGLTFLGVETAQLNLGAGNDTFNLDGSFNAIDITANGNGGNDTFNIKANSGDLVINGGAGDDTFNLDSTAPLTSNGTLNGITGTVTLNGGTQATVAGDQLYLDDRLDTDPNTLTLNPTTIAGIGLTGGVNYTGFEGLTIMLGSGADTANIRNTAIPLFLNTGGGNDSVFVGSSAGLGNTNGTLSSIGTIMTIDGGTGGATVTLDDTGDGSVNTGTLTSTTLTGLGLGGALTYANLSNLVVNLGGGGNTFTIASTHTAATNLSTGGGNDTIAINTVAGATSVSSGNGNDLFRVGSLAPTMVNGNLNGISGLLTLDGGANVNQLILDDSGDTLANTGAMSASTVTGLGMTPGLGINYLNFAIFLLSLGTGGDTFTATSTIAGTTTINLGDGADTFTLGTSAGTLTVNGGIGSDTFNIKGSGGTVTLNGGDGDDTFNFDSNAPNSPGILNNILGVMLINGDNGLNDTLNLDDRLDPLANVLFLTSTTITGLGLTGGITYGTFENLSILFGTGDDTANIRNIAIPTFINTGLGVDQVFVGSNAGSGNVNGSLSGIASTLTLNGGADGLATVTLDDTGDGSVNTGTLTGTTITGLGLATSVIYSNLSTLNLNLGNGGNTFTIVSTHAATTNLNTGNGADQVAVKTISGATTINTFGGDDTIRVGSDAPNVSGSTLNNISGLLTLDAGTGLNNQLFIDDTLDSSLNTGTLTAANLTGLGMAAGINYANFAVLTLTLGSGGDSFTISSTHVGITNLDLGAGDDTLAIVSIAGLTNITGNAGADIITVNSTHLVGTNPIGAVLNLDGNAGGDSYFIWYSSASSSVINVHDTGALDPAVGGVRNNLTLYDTPANDTLLFRKEFVALLQYGAGHTQLPTFEQVNYNSNIDGKLTVNSVGGANYFAFDDNSSETVVNGANQGDTVQIGQIFGTAFIGAGLDPVNEMIETTRGLISPGITHQLTLNGGTGNDVFSVYHNRAKLILNGGDGDDTFVIRSFALSVSNTGKEVFDALRGDTQVDTGGGVNKVSYALSAPVAIDGGNGFNSLVVIGTEFADNIVVTETGVYGGGLQVTFVNIQQLVINLAEGNDNIWILGTPAGTALRIVSGLGSDTVYLGGDPAPMDFFLGVDPVTHLDIIQSIDFAPVHDLSHIHGPIQVEGGLGNGVPNLEPGVGLPGEITGPLPDLGNANLFVNENLQVDRLIVDNTGNTTGQAGMLTANQLTGFGLTPDTIIGGVAFDGGVTYLEFEEVILQLGSGNDTLTIASTHAGRTVVQGNDGTDTVNVQTISGHTTILGGNGADTINVGSLAPATGGNLDGIDALLTLDGGNGADTVNVDQRGNTLGSTGTLTQTTLTGLEMTSVLPTVNDTVSFRVNNTGASFTLSYGGNSVTLAGTATAGDITAALVNAVIDGGLGLGIRSAVVQQVGDEFLINFQGARRSNLVDLTVTGDVTLTHRTAGINYYGTETLNLDLGSGADVVNVQGTAAITTTNLNTHAGEDRIYISSTASLTNTTFTDSLLGSLDYVAGLLNIDAGSERNLLMVSDEASSVANGTLGTPALITHNFIRGFSLGQINYTATAGNFAQGITVWTGAGADIISITSTDVRAGVRTTTTLNTGAGNDTVTVALSSATDDLFAVNTQDGDDTVIASTSTLPIIIFGGAGNDTLTGGLNGDIILGDNGRVQFLNGAAVVAQIGGGGPGDFTDGLFNDSYLVVTFDPAIGGSDTINGLAGDDLILGGAGGDFLNTGEDTNFVIGDEGVITVTSGVIVSATTVTSTFGGSDTVTGLSGNDFLFGGDAGDIINTGLGLNVAFGDHGTVTRNPATGSFTANSIAGAIGGDDTITGDSDRDVIFGGAGSDALNGAAGNDIIFGDSGTVTFAASLPVIASTTLPDTGAGDTIQGGTGADVILGGDSDDTIDGGTGANLVFGDYGTVNWTGSLLSLATATAQGTGGIDLITGGSDNDLILGGTMGDIIHSGAGDDVVFGDEGVITFLNGSATIVSNTSSVGDGNDQIFSEAGNDVVLGGGADDTILAGDGANVILGDNGVITFTNGVLLQAITTTGNTGGNDMITVGNGANWIFGGEANDTITTGNGNNVIFGDSGSITFTGGTLTVVSTDFNNGGADTITAGSGDDIILGSAGADIIDGGDGNNVVFGDHGQVIKTATGLSLVASVAPTQGADDTITTGAGNDIILGGAGNDTIHAGAGRNIIVGDNGRFEFTAGDLRIATVTDYTVGGDDQIDAGVDNDIILGGFGTDTIDAGDGNNVIFGDQGTVSLSGGILIEVYTEQVAIGAGDIIVGGLGNDVILGGFGIDHINAGDGNNVIVGDHAELHWLVGILARMISTDFADGAADEILSGSGNDVILAGPDEDTINAGNGDNIVIGDNATVDWTGGVIVRATTEDSPDFGANDSITTGSGNDIIIGGLGADTINGGDGSNIILGDNGHAVFTAGLLTYIQTLFPENSGNDSISSGSGRDVILGGGGSDNINGGDGDDVIIGDEGSATFSGNIVTEVTSEIFAAGAGDTINGQGGNDIIIGGAASDTINGGEGNNVIAGDNAVATFTNGVLVELSALAPAIGDADNISAGAGNDVILGGTAGDTINGGEGNNVIAGDNAIATFSSGVLVELRVLAPTIGDADNLSAGAGNDVILGGTAGDTINGGDGANIIAGDNATIIFSNGLLVTLTPTTTDLGGNDTISAGTGADIIVGGVGADWINAGNGNNVVAGDQARIVQSSGALVLFESVAFADGGADLIFTGAGNDLVLGGTAGDTIHAGAGNDLVFGDNASVAGNIDLSLLPLAMPVKPFTFTSISTQNLGSDGRSVAGDDVIFGDAGDDILLGQQGNDILFGGDGDDDLIGGHNVSGGQDGADVIDGGAGFDVIAGDNASILRRGDNISPRAHVLAGDALFDDKGNLLDLDTPQAWPTNVSERDTIILDHAFGTDASLFGNDQLVGGAGDDVIFGELGNDQLHGDATLPVTVAADGTIDRTALRATATALFTTNLWVGADSDGDDYLEGNGGNDLIFGGLGQDDIVGGSSSLFGLTDRLQRPDGSDTIYGGNGTAASDQSDSDFALNGRSRDADVIMGDNANIIRLVGLNGISAGAFLTFSYAPGSGQIIVRGFDLLDYAIPASADDIGAADAIYGETGDDTLHGEVGNDLILGNGNDDNLYGGQGDDNLLGGAGDDSISGSDELKAPPPAAGAGGAAEGNGADGTAPGTIILTLPGNLQAILVVDPVTGVTSYFVPKIILTSFSSGAERLGQTDNTGFSGFEGSWRVFSGGILPSGHFGDSSSNAGSSLFNEPAGAEGDGQKQDGDATQPTDNPATPADESQPAATADQQAPAPQDGQTPPADTQAAPADAQPAAGENPPPAEGDQAGTPPADGTTPPAPDAGTPPPVPPTT